MATPEVLASHLEPRVRDLRGIFGRAHAALAARRAAGLPALGRGEAVLRLLPKGPAESACLFWWKERTLFVGGEYASWKKKQ